MVVAVAGCGSSGSGSSGSSSSGGGSHPTVTLSQAGGSDFSSIDVPYFINQLKAQGIKVKYLPIEDTSTMIRAVITGQVDVGIANVTDAVTAVAAGSPVKLVAANNVASDYVLAAKNGITLKNLAGKTLAVDTPGSASDAAARLGLKAVGVNPSTVHYVTIAGTSARETALVAGQIDIAPLHFPEGLAAAGTGKDHILVNDGTAIGSYLQSGVIANTSFLKNTALAQKVVNILLESEHWANTQKAAYIALAKKENLLTGMTAAQASGTWDDYHRIHYFGVNGGLCQADLNRFLQLQRSIGLLPKNLPPTSAWVDPTFVQHYLKAHNQSPTAC
jgi:ABC-type nitrate/sulfonate/bicarbonate transport system substrate-binding protein